jgi:PTS system glucose-specific IIB component
MGLPYSPSSRVITSYPRLLCEQAFFILSGVYDGEFKILSALFLPARPAVPLSDAEKQQIRRLIQAFGGEANIASGRLYYPFTGHGE